MEREGVVDLTSDSPISEVLAELVSPRRSDYVLMKDVACAWIAEGKNNSFFHIGSGQVRLTQEFIIAGGVGVALLVPLRQIPQLHFEDGGLEAIETGVPSDLVVIVAAAHPVCAQDASVVVDCGRSSGDEAGVAHGAEIFCGVEAERGGVAERSGGSVIPGCSEGLGSVFDEEDVVVLFQGRECVPVGALAVEMDWEDGFDVSAGGGLQDLFDCGGGEVEGGGVDVGEEGRGAATENGADGGEEAERSGDDGVAGADVGGGEGKPDGVGAAGATDGVRCGAGDGGGLLEAGDLGAEDEVLRGTDGFDGV